MISLLDEIFDILIEYSSRRQRTLNNISDQSYQIADNLVKIILFNTDIDWKGELINHLRRCQKRKLTGKKLYPTKKEYFQLLYKDTFEPEEPWNKSQCFNIIRNNIDVYSNSRDLKPISSPLSKEVVTSINEDIKEFLLKISEILSNGDINEDYSIQFIDSWIRQNLAKKRNYGLH